MKKKLFSRLFSVLLVVIMIAALSATAFAQSPLPTATISVKKVFNVDNAINIGKLSSSTFTLSRSDYSNGPSGTTMSTANMPMPGGVTGSSVNLAVTLPSGSGTSKDATAAFAAISYSISGVYTYQLAESTLSPVAGVTYDKVVRYIKVYVENLLDSNGNVILNADNTPQVKVAYIEVWRDNDAVGGSTVPGTATKEGVAAAPSGSIDDAYTCEFVNSYGATVNDRLEVTKQVAGANGDTTKDFSFTLATSNNATTNPLAYQVYNASGVAQTGTGKVGTIAHGGTFSLKSGETVRIYGMADGASYTITETNDADSITYTTSISGNSNGGTIAPVNNVTASGTRAAAQQTFTLTNADNQTFTNTKGTTTPTGVGLDVLPFVLLFALGGCGMFALLMGKRKLG